MPYVLILFALLSGCASRHTSPPDCLAAVAVPAPLVGKPTPAKVGELQIRVELAREAERDRGDCWRSAFEGMKK